MKLPADQGSYRAKATRTKFPFGQRLASGGLRTQTLGMSTMLKRAQCNSIKVITTTTGRTTQLRSLVWPFRELQIQTLFGGTPPSYTS